jgi:hypothetical protein
VIRSARAQWCLFVQLFICSLLLLSRAAHADAEIQLELSAEQIEVGQQLRVRLQINSEGDAADSPRLRVPSSFVVAGPSVGTQQQISIVNGQMERSLGTTATWVLTATKKGRFEIGPGTFNLSGTAVNSQSAKVEVVDEGSLPAPRRRRSRFPFDDDDVMPGFGQRGSLLDELFGDPRAPAPQPEAPPEYQLEAAPDPAAFLRATVSPTSAVVGQQVTLRVYAYGARGLFGEGESKESRHPDFLAEPIMSNSAKQRHLPVRIQGQEYLAVKIRELALFPLKAGDLEIGPMTMAFYGRGYMSRQYPEGVPRSSQGLTLAVKEPPLADRPAGYQLGDVGEFELSAEVSPATVEAGGAVSVVATVSGRGRLPADLDPPQRKGIEWLAPSIKDEQKMDREGVLGGTRTFTYLVRLQTPGQLDLGELTLPHWSPRLNRYRVARAKLGEITVSEANTPAPVASAKQLRLSEQFEARAELRGAPPAAWFLTDQVWFFPALLFAPGLVLLLRAGRSWWGGLRQRVETQRSSPLQLATAALAAAEDEVKKGNALAAIAAMERALFLALEAACGVKGRAVLRAQLVHVLRQAGLAAELADTVHMLLSRFEDARFGQQSGEAAGELLRATKQCVKALARKPRAAREASLAGNSR